MQLSLTENEAHNNTNSYKLTLASFSMQEPGPKQGFNKGSYIRPSLRPS